MLYTKGFTEGSFAHKGELVAQFLLDQFPSRSALVLLGLGFTGCTQTQVKDTVNGAGSVLVETVVSTAFDVASGSNSSTRNLSDEELARCGPRGDCLPKAHRKERETDAFIARNRSVYRRVSGASESALTKSLVEWMNTQELYDDRTAEVTSIMFSQPTESGPTPIAIEFPRQRHLR